MVPSYVLTHVLESSRFQAGFGHKCARRFPGTTARRPALSTASASLPRVSQLEKEFASMAVVDESSKAPPGGQGGASWWAGSVSVLPPGAEPDEGVAVALLVVEEVGVNRRVERRIVQLDREVVAALGGALRPGGPDLGVMWCTT